MQVKVLGAHNTESRNTRHTCLLVDDILALDAGGLTSSLSFKNQMKVKAVFLTHAHYDHIRDIPALAINLFLRKRSIDIYTHQAVYDIITQHLLNGKMYPEYHKKPIDNPTLRLHLVEPFQELNIEGYRILPVPVAHAIPALGYQVTSSDNKTLLYTGDTGAGISRLWEHISPQVLFIELTASNRWEQAVKDNGHLTPNLLSQELKMIREIRGSLPRIFAVHINPDAEDEIRTEASQVAESSRASISSARKEQRIQI